MEVVDIGDCCGGERKYPILGKIRYKLEKFGLLKVNNVGLGLHLFVDMLISKFEALTM